MGVSIIQLGNQSSRIKLHSVRMWRFDPCPIRLQGVVKVFTSNCCQCGAFIARQLPVGCFVEILKESQNKSQSGGEMISLTGCLTVFGVTVSQFLPKVCHDRQHRPHC